MLRNIIQFELISADPDTSARELASLMEKHNVGALVILDREKPVGIVTDRDIVIKCLAANRELDECFAKDVMSKSLQTVKDSEGIYSCIEKMRDSKVRRLPVVDDLGKAVGIVSFTDLLAVLSKEFHELTKANFTAEEYRKKAA